MTHPRHTMASWFPLSAKVRAVTGNSSEPGTQYTSGSWTPCSSRATRAPWSRRFETSWLKRETTTATCRSSPRRSGFSPLSPTLEEVTELVFLSLQVALVVRVGPNANRHPLHDFQAEPLQPVDLLGVVGE